MDSARQPRAVGRSALSSSLCAGGEGGEHLSRCAGQEADLSAAGYEELADRRDAHSRTWVQREPATGEVVAQVVEIGARLNYRDAATGAWTPTRIAFEPQADGSALVTRAPDRIRLEPVLGPSSAVTLTKPAEGFEIRLAPAGIGYYDRATGTYEEVAAARPTPLTLDPGTGYAGYLDAFDRLAADIVLIHGISGLAQEVVLRELPPAPTELGYPSDQGVELVVLTEIVNAADLEAQDLRWQGAGAKGELSTEALDLRAPAGGYLFGFLDGFAYYLDGELAVGAPPRGGDLAEVAKGILIIDDRAYLAEVVPPALLGRSELAHAPASRWSGAASEEREIARLDLARAPASEEARRRHLALLRSGGVPGLVLDYTAYSGVLNQDTTFHWRRTYLIKGVVGWNSGRTLTIHPGAIIKFQTEDLDHGECVPLSSYIRIPSGASLMWESDPARITVFTSSCDSSVGDDTRKETTCESDGWGGLKAYDPGQGFTNIADLTSHQAGSVYCALFVPESELHPEGYLLGTRAATRAGTVADLWWRYRDGSQWAGPFRQRIWSDILGSGYPLEIDARGIVAHIAADPVDPAHSALVAVGYEFDNGRTAAWGTMPDHYGLGVVRIRYDAEGQNGDVWKATELVDAERRPQPLLKARTVVFDPHRSNRVYAGTDGCGVAIGVRCPANPD